MTLKKQNIFVNSCVSGRDTRITDNFELDVVLTAS